jgi:hypothetical protein
VANGTIDASGADIVRWSAGAAEGGAGRGVRARGVDDPDRLDLVRASVTGHVDDAASRLANSSAEPVEFWYAAGVSGCFAAEQAEGLSVTARATSGPRKRPSTNAGRVA